MELSSVKLKDGYLGSYFDISQAEPRSIAYLSNDPIFVELYESGKDAYRELAKMSYPEHADDKAYIDGARVNCKGIILSGIYGQSIRTLSERIGVPYEEGNHIWQSFIGKMLKVEEYRQAAFDYVMKYGQIQTVLGDRIVANKARAYTSCMNHKIQNFTAVILAYGFYNAIRYAIHYGIDATVKGVIHDACINEFPINKVIHMYLTCEKHFRNHVKQHFIPDYKYDFDLFTDYFFHIPFKYDNDTRIMKVDLWRNEVDYFFDHFSSGYHFKIIDRKDYTKKNNIYSTGGIDNALLLMNKTHKIMEGEEYLKMERSTIEIELNRPLDDIDWYYQDPPYGEDLGPLKFNRSVA